MPGHLWDIVHTESAHFADAKHLTALQLWYILGTVSTTARPFMDKKAVSERLRALASDDQKRSKAARLRDVIDDVETALAAGVSRADVLAELKAHGLDMSLATFDTTLKRLRAKRGHGTAKLTPQPATAALRSEPVPAVSAPPAPSEPGDASHNPADIDRITSSKPDLSALSKLAKRSKK